MKRRHIALAVACGLAAVAYLALRDIHSLSFSGVRLSGHTVAGLLLAMLLFAGQNFCLMWRYHHLACGSISWRQAFRVDALCEFTSAVTPSAVGGSSLIFWFLHREGMNAGRSTAVMMSTLMMDELFLTLGCLVVLALMPAHVLFGETQLVNTGVQWLFIGVLVAVAVWTAVLYVALFHKPQWVGRVLVAVFSLPVLRRWKPSIEAVAHDICVSSESMRSHGFGFWLKTFGITVGAWSCRYAVVNAVLFAFASGGDHLLAFARQFVLWVVAMISPTPGGSGLNEYMFSVYYSDFTADAGTLLVAVLAWRLITYYSYLLVGTFVIPSWLSGHKNPQNPQHPVDADQP